MYRNISYYTDQDRQGMVKIDTWDKQGNRVTVDYPAYSSLWYEDVQGTEMSMFNTKLKYRSFKNTYDRFNWMRGDSNKRYFECLAPTKEFLYTMYKGQQETAEFAKYPLRVFFTDIEIAVEDEFPESDLAKYPINVITIYDTLTKKYYVWYCTKENVEFDEEDDKEYFGFISEYAMLNHFMDWWKDNRPDVVSGWNVLAFDMPYLVNRIEQKCARSKEFSPVGKIKSNEMNPKESNFTIKFYTIEGLSILDQLLLYRDKFVFKKQPYYSLDQIAEVELGEHKLELNEAMRDIWKNQFKTWVVYNIKDVKLCVDLEEKLNHIGLVRMMCNMGLCEYESIYKSSPYILGSIVLQGNSMGKKVVTRVERDDDDDVEFTGAFVFPCQAGVYHRGVFSVDLNSLYPNIMITLNMSPETKVGVIVEENEQEVIVKRVDNKMQKFAIEEFKALLENNLTRSANGVLYFKHHIKKGILPEFLERIYNERQSVRKEGFEKEKEAEAIKGTLDSLSGQALEDANTKIKELESEANFLDTAQMARKILINSLYGQLGSKYFPMFDLDNAEAVTLTGQLINKSAAKFVSSYAHKYYGAEGDVIIYGDTDSVANDTLIRTKTSIIEVTDSETGKKRQFNPYDLLTVRRDGINIDILSKELKPEDEIIEV